MSVETERLSTLSVRGAKLTSTAPTTFDHDFRASAITVVLGANRSGKTDLCRLMAGLPTSAQGQVLLGGEDITHLAPQKRSVALVFQAFVNYPNLTVAQNIASPLVAQGISQADQRVRVEALAQSLRIENLLDRLPAELSGGQQQRLAIARALAKQAAVLLLDEPLVNLDFKLREALEEELRQLLTEQQTTVIYTSSDPRDAFNLADEVVLLDQWVALQAGSPLEVYQAPVTLPAMGLMCDPGVNRFDRDGQQGGVRPEHLRPGANGEFVFQMAVAGVETSGDHTFVHGEVDGHDWVMRTPGMFAANAGAQLTLSAMASDVKLFGGSDGAR